MVNPTESTIKARRPFVTAGAALDRHLEWLKSTERIELLIREGISAHPGITFKGVRS